MYNENIREVKARAIVSIPDNAISEEGLFPVVGWQ